ncbi:MAG: PEP-CTERM sorting domain-containing protein [Aulosira sp. ZfuVER01]|nr:PEP-CTERM sorting domain-containing protein [Aulosira sp. ZfuVER01]MDZ8002310.1 PEP-CTERM sorting domain-containing protein [Aulosira sp. DedVER01a]MDZ8052686.1 PEP-CTERM sorting domain-containing protein [Aulosira sp. ZfuCHP01]
MKNLALLSSTALAITSGLGFGIMQSASALSWDWNYYDSGAGIDACGTFTTKDTPNSSGFYQITGITGIRNGETITGLQLTGTAIPGNEPYIVDNLISPSIVKGVPQPQLTDNGFGYSTSGGHYYNPFFTLSSPAGYYEVSYTNQQYSQPPITFYAIPMPGRSDIFRNSSLKCDLHKPLHHKKRVSS